SFERAGDVVQILERLVGPALGLEILGEPGACEDPLCGEGRATVGVAVADVDDAPFGEAAALAPVATDLARRFAVPADEPAVGLWIEPVGDQLDLDALAREQ